MEARVLQWKKMHGSEASDLDKQRKKMHGSKPLDLDKQIVQM